MGKLVLVYFIVLITMLPFTLDGFIKELRFSRQEEIAKGACGCAVFIVPETDPVLEETLQYNVSCNEKGAIMCQELCNILARNSCHKTPMMICEKLLNTRIEKLKIYMKICNTESWKFTGLESARPICCREGKTVLCDEMM